MMKRVAITLIALGLLLAPAAYATTYVMMADEDLTDISSAIARARVVDVTVVQERGTPYTEYSLVVEDAVKGVASGEAITVRVLGGVDPDGRSLKIWGTPNLQPAESALVFLARDRAGSWTFSEMALGVFRVRPNASGRDVAVRDLGGAVGLQMDTARRRTLEQSLRRAHLPRDAERFVSWLRDRASGLEREPDYYLPKDERPLASVAEKFTFLQANGRPIRWVEFTRPGGLIDWFAYRKGRTGLSLRGRRAVEAALTAWSAVYNIRFNWRGKNNASAGFSTFDGVNTVAFEDPSNDIAGSFDCSRGGTVAIGGPWFDGSDGGNGTYAAIGADIVFQDNLQCFFDNGVVPEGADRNARGNDILAEEVVSHELGHTLGLGHSCEDVLPCGSRKKNEAQMRWAVHNDGRGHQLNTDDRKGLRKLGYNGS